MMMKKPLYWLIAVLGGACAQAQDMPRAAVSESDYFSDVPVVLSVSRLAQRIDETPGAVTILDKDFIRKSGARDVADLLRLVPGFQTTTSFETDAPMASYHGRTDDFSNRIQVLVDGRSVYSSYLQGSAGIGLQTLAMEDIERIEILRGSNSAAYGARAFLGVINIVSKDVRETLGPSVGVTAGDNAVLDGGARLGWGDDSAAYRVSADSRQDDGLRGAYGRNQVQRANFSANFQLSPGKEMDVRAGYVGMDAGRGTPGDSGGGNLSRMRYMGAQFLQWDWRNTVSDSEDWAVSVSHSETVHRDSFPFLPDSDALSDRPGLAIYYGITVDFSGHEYNDNVSLQYTRRNSDTVRFVAGGELRREDVVSASSFSDRGHVSTDFSRLFGNVEWRVHPQLVLNLGASGEHSDIGGDMFSPRLMANWHVAPGHTLRAGYSTAFRPPSPFEKYAYVRYFDSNGANPLTLVRATGAVQPEKLTVRELGYNFSLPAASLTGDVRLFDERVTNGIGIASSKSTPDDYGNIEAETIRGGEYQLTWKPTADTTVFWNQAQTTISDSLRAQTLHGAAHWTSALAVMQNLPHNWNVSLTYQNIDGIDLMSAEENNGIRSIYSMQRADVRVAKTFRWGKSRAELALTVQNLDSPLHDGNRKFYFDRRGLLSLRIDR